MSGLSKGLALSYNKNGNDEIWFRTFMRSHVVPDLLYFLLVDPTPINGPLRRIEGSSVRPAPPDSLPPAIASLECGIKTTL